MTRERSPSTARRISVVLPAPGTPATTTTAFEGKVSCTRTIVPGLDKSRISAA